MHSDIFLKDGGEMGSLIRAHDWAKTPLGIPESWPQVLKILTRTMLNNKFGTYIAWGKDYIQIYNDSYLPILEAFKHPAIGLSAKETFTEIWNTIGPMFQEVMNGGSIRDQDFKLQLTRNGVVEDYYFDFSYTPIYSEEDEVEGILITVIDTTLKVNSLKRLDQSEKSLRNLVINAPVGMCVLKGANHIVEIVNDAMLKLWGTSRDIVTGNPLFKALPIVTNQGIEESLDHVLKTGKSFSGKNSLNTYLNGGIKKHYLNSSYEPYKDQYGNITGIIGVAIDVTEQVESKKELEESEANLQRLVMNAPVAMCVLKEPDYKVEIANDLMLEIWGIHRDGVMKKAIFEALPDSKNQGLEEILENVYQTGGSFAAQEHPVVIKRNGKLETVYLNFSYEPFRDNRGVIVGIMAVAVNVTILVQARQKVEESEERARLAIESADIGTYDIDLKTDTIITSHRFDEIFGLPSGSSSQDYRKIYHPEDLQIRNDAFDKGLKEGYLNFQVRLLLKDESIKWVRFQGKVYNDKQGKPIRLIGTALDITVMVEMHRQKDDFIAIASHELKTPLTSIKGYIQILETLIKKEDQFTSLNIIKKTARQITKMTKLIHSFLDLSKLESDQLKLEKENFNLNDLISETINYYNLPENKERFRFNQKELPNIFADKSKIGHVIDNLLSNALKYSEKNEVVIVKTYIDDQSATVSFTDRGKGINESSKQKIFQRFYRADNTAGGTISGFGIGLYFSAEVIKLHNGKIWFESEEGEGSTFYFSLPIE